LYEYVVDITQASEMGALLCIYAKYPKKVGEKREEL
jgi:hypothetical protein